MAVIGILRIDTSHLLGNLNGGGALQAEDLKGQGKVQSSLYNLGERGKNCGNKSVLLSEQSE